MYKLTKSGAPRTDTYIGTIDIVNGKPATTTEADFVKGIKKECKIRNAALRKSLKLIPEWLKPESRIVRWRWNVRGRGAPEKICNRGSGFNLPLTKATYADVYLYPVYDWR